MRDTSPSPKDGHEDDRRLAELRRQKKRHLSAFSLAMGASCAAAAAFVGLDWMMAGAMCLVLAIKLASDLRRKLMEFDLEIALAELDKIEGQMLEERRLAVGQEADRQEQRKMMLAGIEFNTPAGRFEGAVVYRYAVREGRSYEYAGLAGAMDEPGQDMLIVNDLIYRLAPGQAGAA